MSIFGSTAWGDPLVPLTLDGPFPRLPSPPPNPSFRSGSSSNSSSASSVSSRLTPTGSQTEKSATLKRKRAAAVLSTDERLQRRRAQHRAVDASRRQKENEAIARLHVLVRQQQEQQQQQVVGVQGDIDDESAEGDDDNETSEGRKAGRLAVLESSIALIEQLTTACQRMEVACNAKDAQVSRVSSQLHSVAAVIAQQASSLALAESEGGYATGLAASSEYGQPWQQALPSYSSHPSLLPSTPHSYPYPQASSQPHSHSHPRSRPHVRPLSHPHSESTFLSVLPPSTSSYLLQSDASHTLQQSTTSLLETMSMTVIVLPSKVVIDVNDNFLQMSGHLRSEMMYHSLDDASLNKGVNQYPASLAAVEEVISGSKRHGRALWRCRRVSGILYEVMATFYGLYDEPRADRGSTDEQRIPDRMLIISAPDDVMIVGEEHAADVM